MGLNSHKHTYKLGPSYNYLDIYLGDLCLLNIHVLQILTHLTKFILLLVVISTTAYLYMYVIFQYVHKQYNEGRLKSLFKE